MFAGVCGDRATGAAVVSHPIPEMVSITGSIAAGMAGARAAADGYFSAGQDCMGGCERSRYGTDLSAYSFEVYARFRHVRHVRHVMSSIEGSRVPGESLARGVCWHRVCFGGGTGGAKRTGAL